jgi:carbon monoxide dehydrogenase subunit G
MQTVRESTSVQAPPDRIFRLLAEPERAVVFVPGLNRIQNVSSNRELGCSWDFEFNWLGWIVSGRSECTRYQNPTTYQFKTLTGNRSTWTYSCEPDGNSTRLTLEVEYEVPENQLARFASEGVLKRMNENTAREIVDNLKALVES